jgi:hypothetical protein
LVEEIKMFRSIRQMENFNEPSCPMPHSAKVGNR